MDVTIETTKNLTSVHDHIEYSLADIKHALDNMTTGLGKQE